MNHRNPAIKRILADVKELQRHPSSRYHATPLEDNMFEWHFTIRGPDDTAFAGGIYHGRILLPAEYPFKPPNIVFLTKNGRFEVGTKICLSISAYHEETWQPAWGVRTMLEAIISFLPSEGAGAIGALDWSAEERKRLARLSHSFVCPTCGPIAQLLSEPSKEEEEKPDSTIQEQVAQLHFGPPTRSDSVKHTLTTAATDLLLANALGSPVAPPLSTAALSPDLAGNITVDDDNITTTTLELDQNPESVILADSHDTAVSEMVMEETTIELSEDAVDNFETLQDIEEVRRRFQHHPSKRGVKEENEKSETDKSVIESKETVTHPRPNPLTQHNPPAPPAPAAAIPPLPRQAPPRLAPQNNHNVVEQLRRIEEFLNTIILITVVGILAILIRVFIRNILNVDL